MTKTTPRSRTIVVAETLLAAAARGYTRKTPGVVAVVTPIIPDAAHGIDADRILVLAGMYHHPRTPAIVAACMPSLLARSIAGSHRLAQAAVVEALDEATA